MAIFDRYFFKLVVVCTVFSMSGTLTNIAAAQEGKGPLPVGKLQSQKLSAEQIVPWVNRRRDITAHIFAISGDAFREIARFEATEQSCRKYMNEPADLKYTEDKNFYGNLSDVPLGTKVRVVCSENINKFSMQKQLDEIVKLIARLEKRPTDAGPIHGINIRIGKLVDSIGRQGREIEKQNRKLSDILQKVKRIDDRVRRIKFRR